MSKNETEFLEAVAKTEVEAEIQTDQRNRVRRRRLFVALGATVLAAGSAFWAYERFYASHFVSTDNAYTAAETAQVTPAVGGIVREVRVSDTQPVRKDEVIVQLDDTDAVLALAQAEAELGRAVRRVRGYVANDDSLAAQIAARASEEKRAAAQVAAAQADFERAEIDLKRRAALAGSGSVSGDELTRARNAFETARANLAAAQAQAAQTRATHQAAIGSREANAVLIADATEDSNPEVALARARRDQARVNLERTVIRAPIDGVVARRTVQVGQQVQAGAALLSVVPVAQVHVDANFKEVQLDRVRIGQAVELKSDLYGSAVTYHGVVAGLAGGTGSSFATIPAQNATGNWIKVVQRVPVRVWLDPDELAARPLQVGLSMTATIDTRGTGH
ncbi:HlyD family secretion protein [Variovorax sp. JS1663]|uniref:HlyD family secretion protein n=1 Tax=Variovorax sp. JS1663 TaxID=1851577 RepID=UPI000B348655|nr:HlyD family secretion protein [Variovorax sp. JS1663]